MQIGQVASEENPTDNAPRLPTWPSFVQIGQATPQEDNPRSSTPLLPDTNGTAVARSNQSSTNCDPTPIFVLGGGTIVCGMVIAGLVVFCSPTVLTTTPLIATKATVATTFAMKPLQMAMGVAAALGR